MKRILTVIFSVLFISSTYAGEDISYFRSSFQKIKDYETAKAFLDTEISKNGEANSITINSYKAVCKMMMAQYVYNPFSKYAWFKEGKQLLEESIGKEKNVENSYLRLIVQLHIPSFLGYTTEIESDTQFLLDNLESSSIPVKTKQYILKNLIGTKNKKVDSLKPLAIKYEVL